MNPTDTIGDATLYLTDSVFALRAMPDASVEAVVTDPPYSSGGMFRGDRAQSVAAKYVQGGFEHVHVSDFAGDNRDQRSWAYWCHMWLSEAIRVTKPGGLLLMFSDWRQVPTASDVIQSAGWVWRGLISWDKGPSSRAPAPHYFRHQCEYVLWASRGALEPFPDWPPEGQGCYPGSYTVPVKVADKHHVVGKPTALMRDLVFCVPPGATVLDPFMGSATTGVACLLEGRKFVGIETDERHYETALKRLEKAAAERRAAIY